MTIYMPSLLIQLISLSSDEVPPSIRCIQRRLRLIGIGFRLIRSRQAFLHGHLLGHVKTSGRRSECKPSLDLPHFRFESFGLHVVVDEFVYTA